MKKKDILVSIRQAEERLDRLAAKAAVEEMKREMEAEKMAWKKWLGQTAFRCFMGSMILILSFCTIWSMSSVIFLGEPWATGVSAALLLFVVHELGKIPERG